MSFERIRHRLESGRPLVLDSDTCAAFRARGVALDSPGTVGRLLRHDTELVLDHYRAEVASRVDVLSALTADTTPRALAEVGMEHRAAALTGLAVDLAFEAREESEKPVAVAGLLGSELVSPLAPTRLHEELQEHARRLAIAGCELLLARGMGSRINLMAAVVAAAGTELPTWAVVELVGAEPADGSRWHDLLVALEQAGASVVLLEASDVPSACAALAVAQTVELPSPVPLGVLLSADAPSVRGFPGSRVSAGWWSGASGLDEKGARVIGGGAGTTEAHTAALARALGELHPSLPPSRG